MNNRFLHIVAVDDYHGIEEIADSFPGLNLKSIELGTTVLNSFKYIGLIYEGRKPSKETIQNLLSLSGIELED